MIGTRSGSCSFDRSRDEYHPRIERREFRRATAFPLVGSPSHDDGNLSPTAETAQPITVSARELGSIAHRVEAGRQQLEAKLRFEESLTQERSC